MMTETEYNQKFKNAKTQQERDFLNNEYSNSIHKQVIIRKVKKYLKEHHLELINLILVFITLIIGRIGLLK